MPCRLVATKRNPGLAGTAVLLGILCLFATYQSAALDPSVRISQYGHRAWRVQDGTLGGSPIAFAQTPDGYIWVGTQGGLYRFDGATFTAWNPPPGQQYPKGDATILSLLAARDGSLWIGTASGLAHWKNGRFTSVSAPDTNVESIAEDRDGEIWITRSSPRDSGPICRVVDDEEQCYGKSDGIQALTAAPIAADAQGRLWIGAGGTLIEWQKKLIAEYPLPGGMGHDSSRMILGVAVEDNGTVWAGVERAGPHDGLQRFLNGQWRSYTAPGLDPASLAINELLLDHDGSLWIGTDHKGIYRIHGKSVDHFSHADGLSGNDVEAIFQDQEGGIWIATDAGIDHLYTVPVVTYSTVEGLSSGSVHSVLARDDGSIWVAGNSSMVNVIRGSTVTTLNMKAALHGNEARCMLQDHQGGLWLSTDDGGLVAEVNGLLRDVMKGDGTSLFRSLAEDADHVVWGVLNGPHPRLVRIQGFQVHQEFTPPQVPPAYGVIPDPHGGIWLGLVDGGLMHYRNGQWQTVSTEPLSRKYGSIGDIFNMSVDSNGTVLGASAGGVVGYRNGNLQLLNERNGLPCKRTWAVISDVRNDLWIDAQCALVRIEHSEMERWWANPDTQLNVSTFTNTEGFQPGLPFSRPAMTRSSDGRLWFQNDAVVMVIDPANLAENTVVPPVHVEQVIADRKTYPAQSDLRLPARTRQLELDYTGLSYVAPSRVLFRYMLEGYDHQWQEPGTRRAAFYNDLSPGKYTFRVSACNNSGLWNTEGASLHFTILPAFYQTNWFRALCVVAFFALLWSIYRLRIQQLHKQFDIGLQARVDERTRVARELHDTLLQNFQASLVQMQAARNLLSRHPEKAVQTLDDAIEATAGALDESRDAIQGLRSVPMASGNLAELLTTTSEDLAKSGNTPPILELVEEGERRTLSPAMKDEICRIALEVLRNAYRHANAHSIEAEVRYGEDVLRLRIRDDGKGIDPKVLQDGGIVGHYGLRGMRERAQRMGAKLDLWTEAGAGTEIQLTVPASVAYENSRSSTKIAS
jgi:signal transduction histidine kinase/ligand-binding sensor domain-containing protein